MRDPNSIQQCRNVQSRKMVHAALLLLMLEGRIRGPRFTISLKRSTPKFQLSTRTPADYPIFWHKADITTMLNHVRFRG
jgi:hypothetical protein